LTGIQANLSSELFFMMRYDCVCTSGYMYSSHVYLIEAAKEAPVMAMRCQLQSCFTLQYLVVHNTVII